MLTLSLDEYGDFEGLKKEKAPVYIAGVIYDDGGDEHDLGIERNRIRAFYQAVIADAAAASSDPDAFTYPEALHSDGRMSRDHNVVRPVKQRVNASLGELIRKGTYHGIPLEYEDRDGLRHMFPERTGCYHLFVMLRSDSGMARLLGENVGILAKDDYAGNLYFHMAGGLMSRLVFYNPVIGKVSDIALDIATRTSPDLAPDDPMVEEYKKLGYQPKKVNEKDPKSPVYFTLTNADIYRSVLSNQMLDSGKTDIVIRDFKVRSISYREKAAGRKMEFLYMADSLCSLLGYDLRRAGDNADAWLREIRFRIGQLTNRPDDLVFGYDEINYIFDKAWKRYEGGDFYCALGLAFDGMKMQGAFADLYREVWFGKLEERIRENAAPEVFGAAVRRLGETLENHTFNQDRCMYVIRTFEKILPDAEKRFQSPEARRILYRFYDACVTAYSHIGDSGRAAAYFDKCRDQAELVSLEDHLATRNKMVSYLCDAFDFEKALAMAEEDLSYRTYLNEMRARIHFKAAGAFDDPAMGEAFSLLGQVQAFMRRPEAEGTFRQALRYFDRDSAGYRMTQGRLLHHLIDTGEWAASQSESIDYFGGCMRPEEQLDHILDESGKAAAVIDIRSALYVFVRNLYTFRLSEMSDELWERLKRLEERGRNDLLTGHPAELIYKYLRLITISRDEGALEKAYAKRMWECLKYAGPTEEVIMQFGDVFCAAARGDIRLRDERSKKLCEMMRSSFTALSLENIPEDGDRRYLWLIDHITFTHR